MRIAIFEPKFLTPPPNSASYLVIAQRQARSLARVGHKVIVLTEGNKAPIEEEANLTIYPLKGLLTSLSSLFSASRRKIPTFSHLSSPDILLSAARKLKKADVDVIYSCGTSFMASSTAFLGYMTNLPTVHYVFQYAGPWKWWRPYTDTFQGFKVPLRYTIWEVMKNSLYQPLRREFIHRWGLRHVTQIIASSYNMRETLINIGLNGENITVIYPAVDIPPLTGAKSPQTQLITYMGHLWQGRGVLDLLMAFSKVAERHPEAKLMMATTNIEVLTEHYFNFLSDKYRLDSRIIHRGIVKDPGSEIMAPASVIVLPYRDAPSIKLIEAMAWGKPVVTTNIGWIPELITDGINGFLVKPGDTDGLADKIEMVLANRELAQAVGKKARETVEEKFSVDRNTGDLLAILHQAVEAKEKKSS